MMSVIVKALMTLAAVSFVLSSAKQILLFLMQPQILEYIAGGTIGLFALGFIFHGLRHGNTDAAIKGGHGAASGLLGGLFKLFKGVLRGLFGAFSNHKFK